MHSIFLHFASRVIAAALMVAIFATATQAATAAASGAPGTAGGNGAPGTAGGNGAAGTAGGDGAAGTAGGNGAAGTGNGPGAGSSGGGHIPAVFGSGADAAAACSGGLELAIPPSFGDPGDAVKALSRATQSYIKQCRCVTQQCIADALDKYAEALAVIAPRLPPQLQDVPDVVARAARRVRVARTKAQAVKALQEAIAVIHKDLVLVRAEDPENTRRETRSGDFVADTLNVASLSLEKAGGL